MASPCLLGVLVFAVAFLTGLTFMGQSEELFTKSKAVPSHFLKYLVSHPKADSKSLFRLRRGVLQRAQAERDMDIETGEGEGANAGDVEFKVSVKSPLIKYQGSAESEEEKHIVEERTPEVTTAKRLFAEDDDVDSQEEEKEEKEEETTGPPTSDKPKKPVRDPKIGKYANKIRQAMHGYGVDEQAFIDIVAETDSVERLRIAHEYRQQYGVDLEREMKKELNNRDFGQLIKSMFIPKPAFLATEVRSAIHGLGTDEDSLSQILCCLTPNEFQAVLGAYRERFKKELSKDLKGDTSGLYGRLLLRLADNNRNEEEMTAKKFDSRVEKALKKLNPGLPAKLQPSTKKPKRNEKKKPEVSDPKETDFLFDKEAFIEVFATQSFGVIAQAAQEFQKRLGFELQETIRAATSADFQTLLLNILHFSQNSTEFYARTVHTGFDSSFSFNRKPLTRALVMLERPELKRLQEVYNHIFQRGLNHALHDGMITNNYKTAVSTLLNNARGVK